ncbi:MAG TPA: FecR domain-containing protein [Phenylobacterium sp.]|uniref:FecR family protein n=1 Tax=Phenylobacterium sp. TaxID=1871053 RepID=UPI002D64BED5|nr:FecR domain-containing protein [Phenylobacterium sp.]HZZ68243.1 FecR domain-containing protein [Phenylobacterium sp.]
MIDAAAWIARLDRPEAGEDDAADFDAWLAVSPANGAAYRRTLALWHEFDAAAPQVLAELATPARRPGFAPPRRRFLFAGIAAAAAAAVVFVALPLQAPEIVAQTFVTAKGQHQRVRLSDGSVIDLNAETRLTAKIGGPERRIALADGEAIFDVAPDKIHPFIVQTSEGAVRVVGTQFDVRSRDGQLTVTVSRGKVAVRPASAAESDPAVLLTPGMQFSIGAGRPEAISHVDPQEAFSWRQGRLVYRDQPLTDVVADLNRQFAEQIRIDDPSLDRIRITGVIVLDNPRAVTERLALMLPIRTVSSQRELLLLRK